MRNKGEVYHILPITSNNRFQLLRWFIVSVIKWVRWRSMVFKELMKYEICYVFKRFGMDSYKIKKNPAWFIFYFRTWNLLHHYDITYQSLTWDAEWVTVSNHSAGDGLTMTCILNIYCELWHSEQWQTSVIILTTHW